MERLINGKLEIRPISLRYHRVWDEKVRNISKGLTVCPVTVGHWVDQYNILIERMIPVRISCSFDEIQSIAKMTAKYYNQKAIMFYKVSDEVYIQRYD